MRFHLIESRDVCPPGLYFRQCHASTLLWAGEELLAAWFAGEREGAPDVTIRLARRRRGAWEAPRVVAADPGGPCWNPVLARVGPEVQLYYKTGPSPDRWRSRRIVSADGGRTFSAPQDLPGDRGPAKNKPLLLRSGTLCAPGSTEAGGVWDAFTDISRDGGATWALGGFVPFPHGTAKGAGIIQPTLWEDGEGLHMLARSTEGCLFAADSRDGGRSWSPARRTELPNNNSGVDLCRMDDGALVLAMNPVSGNWAARNRLSLLVSRDGFRTFAEALRLEDDPDERTEYSYPAVVCRGGELAVSYTWRRRTIRVCRLRAEG